MENLGAVGNLHFYKRSFFQCRRYSCRCDPFPSVRKFIKIDNCCLSMMVRQHIFGDSKSRKRSSDARNFGSLHQLARDGVDGVIISRVDFCSFAAAMKCLVAPELRIACARRAVNA
jgi:hypothetical protein